MFEHLLMEWSGNGFFYEARQMNFMPEKAYRVLDKLEELNPSAMRIHERLRLIQIIWELPFAAQTYRERCLDAGADIREYDRFVRLLHTRVNRLIEQATSLNNGE